MSEDHINVKGDKIAESIKISPWIVFIEKMIDCLRALVILIHGKVYPHIDF